MQNKPFKQGRKAFTLIEVIIYIAMVAMVFVSLIGFLWNILGAQVRAEVSSELVYNARIVFEHMSRNVRMADDVVSNASIFGTHPGTLVLSTGASTITFDTYEKSLTVGGKTVMIRTFRMRRGVEAPVYLTSDRVTVTDFVVSRRTRGTEPQNMKVAVTLSYVNPGQDPMRAKQFSFETAISIRKQ